MFEQRQLKRWYQPRDIGGNRQGLYTKDGKWIRDEVFPGFWFESVLEIFTNPVNARRNEMAIRDGVVFHVIPEHRDQYPPGIVIGYILDKPKCNCYLSEPQHNKNVREGMPLQGMERHLKYLDRIAVDDTIEPQTQNEIIAEKSRMTPKDPTYDEDVHYDWKS